jgi:hypothetical protein
VDQGHLAAIRRLDRVPTGESSATALDVAVSGDGVTSYRFALGDDACTELSAAISVATHITIPLGADGPKTLCVAGIAGWRATRSAPPVRPSAPIVAASDSTPTPVPVPVPVPEPVLTPAAVTPPAAPPPAPPVAPVAPRRERPRRRPTVSAPPVAPRPERPPEPEPPPAPDVVHVTVHSVPAGARVMRLPGGEEIGTTSLTIPVRRGEPLRVRIEKNAYQPVVRDLPTGADRGVSVTLRPALAD